MAIAIRPYREADRAAVRELTVSGFEGVSIDHNIEQPTGPDRRAGLALAEVAGHRWRHTISRNELAVAEDEESGTVVGYVTMQGDPETRIGWNHNLAVAGRRTRRRAGRRLIEHALATSAPPG